MTINNLLIKDELFAPLSKLIKLEYNKLMNLILQIPMENRYKKIIDFSGGQVSVADLIAYQIGWGNLLIGWHQDGIKGKMPDMPGEGFTKWDYTGLAQHFYKKYQYDNGNEQIKQFHNVVQKIINIVENEYKNGNLDKTGKWAWCTLSSGKQWPLSKWITVNSSAPYKRASGLIRRYLKSKLKQV